MKYPGKITSSALYHVGRKPATVAYPFGPLKIEPNYRDRYLLIKISVLDAACVSKIVLQKRSKSIMLVLRKIRNLI